MLEELKFIRVCLKKDYSFNNIISNHLDIVLEDDDLYLTYLYIKRYLQHRNNIFIQYGFGLILKSIVSKANKDNYDILLKIKLLIDKMKLEEINEILDEVTAFYNTIDRIEKENDCKKVLRRQKSVVK